MEKKLLNVFVGKDENEENPYFLQMTQWESGKRKIIFSLDERSFLAMFDLFELFSGTEEMPDGKLIIHNGKKLGKNGKPYQVEALGRSEFEKIKNIKNESIMT